MLYYLEVVLSPRVLIADGIKSKLGNIALARNSRSDRGFNQVESDNSNASNVSLG